MSLAALLAQVARRLPDAPAVQSQGVSLSFRALQERVQRLAAGLQQVCGLQRGDRVLLFMENRLEFFDIVFACWAAGLAVVPVNAKLHRKEVEFIAHDAGARLILTSAALAPVLSGTASALANQARFISVESDAYKTLLQAAPAAVMQLEPTALAWLFYTSGTTGRPKGAMLTHRNLLFMCQCYYADIDQISEGDTQLHAAPLSHGAGLYSLPHLLAGGCQVVHAYFDADAIIDCINRTPRVSLFAAPTMLTRLVKRCSEKAVRAEHLKCLVYGGAPMYVADLQKALACFGPRLYHLFGQGESPMSITGLSRHLHQGANSQQTLARLGSVGYARTGVEVRVVDENGLDAPFGQVGEILTRSEGMMPGYWNNPEATQQAIQDGWLRTGDLGSLQTDGLLHLHDRSKDLIISGGSNIYPREIEEVLLRDARVAECAVIGRPDADWGELPVAFVVCQPGMAVAPEELDALVLANMARFKRPRHYVFVDTLPKNHYGKVLKTSLRGQLDAMPDALNLTIKPAIAGVR